METKNKKTYQKPLVKIVKGKETTEALCIEHESEYETCVLCHRQTDVLKSELISRRRYYIEGEGQLCPDCARKLEEMQESLRINGSYK